MIPLRLAKWLAFALELGLYGRDPEVAVIVIEAWVVDLMQA